MSLRRSARHQTSQTIITDLVSPTTTTLKTLLKTQNGKASGRVAAVKSPGSPSKKGEGAADNDGPLFKTPTKPATPARKRRKISDGDSTPNPPPFTPTPSAIGLMTDKTPLASQVSYSTGDIDDAIPSLRTRPAEPHISNAAIESPTNGEVVTAYANRDDASPSKTNGLPAPSTTTGTLLDDALAHLLRVDDTGRLKAVIGMHHCKAFSTEGLNEVIDPFRSLASGIMAQQVSGAAASSIKNKFIALFPTAPHFPAPAVVAKTDIATLRSAGLSQRKAEYIQGLAQKFANNELTAEMLARASDDEVMEKLVAVRGLGKWSVEMFACFGLKRMDVFSTGDLGVQRGMAAYVGRDVSKLKAKGGGKWKYMSERDMLDISAKFSPYRSLFMWYMWRIEDVNVDAIQNTSI